MNLDNILALARKHLGGSMESSARFCLAQAVERKNEGALDAARYWAVRSLSYSIGILHPDYARATK